MKSNEIKEILSIIDLALTVGVPLIQSIVDTWESDTEVTSDMIQAVLDKMHDPDDLFKED